MSLKRERKLARAKFERQQQRRTARQNRNTFLKVLSSTAAIVAAVVFVMQQKNTSDSTPEPISSSNIATAPVIDGCTEASAPRANNISFPEAPTNTTAAKEITLSTNCGDIVIKTDKKAPNTVGVLSYLVQSKFYDGVNCHRLTTDGIFILQCGDPAGNGQGGPGFKFADENLPIADSKGNTVYPAGTVAMANSGPNTNGSQFFLVYQDSPLPANYTVWGKISAGLDRIQAIAAAGIKDGSTITPAQTVIINSATTTP